MKKNYLLFFVLFLVSSLSIAQTYTMANGANGTISACSGTFVDGGGSGGNYNNNQSSTITFCPSTPGNLVRLTFTSFSTENNYDALEMWNGNAIAGPADDTFMGALGAFTITSSSPDGCMTLRFTSDTGTRDAGWVATVSCITPCTPPVAALVSSATVDICPPTAVTPGSLTVPFNASASTSAVGSVVRYEWDWGDGTTNITATPNTTHTFPGVGGLYVVRLRVRNNNFSTDPLGCLSMNSLTRTVRVMPQPGFTGTTVGPLSTTCGNSVTLNGLAISQTITQATPAVISGPVTLPDGSGSSYTSNLDFSGLFPAGATLTAGCYPSLTFNLDHSYSGDLEISLIAPSGESVMVYDQHGGGIHFGTCTDAADDLVPGCVAPYTVVNSGGVAWTAAGVTTTTTATCAVYSGACEGGSYYIPQTYNSTNLFTTLNGATMNGVWTLQVKDNLTLDDGVLSNWSLTFPTACYASLQTITPDLSTATWSHAGAGPAVPAQTTTSTVANNPGPAPCPAPGPCVGNQLANNVSIGPFPTAGSFVYAFTVTDEFGCQYRRNVTVNVTALCPTANISYAGIPFCNSTVTPQNVTLTGTAAYTVGTYSSTTGLTINPTTGAITPSTSTPGTYTVTYTIPSGGCCAVPVTATTSVTINAQPNAGTDGNTTVCDSSIASIDLFSLITGEQTGGAWTRLTGTGGTFNAGAGTFVPAAGATSSTFQYSLTGTAPCINDVSVATITINPQPNAGTDGNTTVCDSSVASINLFSLITGEQAGGTWTRLTGTGGTFNAGAGTFVPAAGATSSTFQYSLTGTAPCINDVSVATITINAQPNAGTDGNTTICDSSIASIDLFSLITGEQAGGTWTRLTGTGGTFNAGAGTFVPAAGATSSTFQYSLTGIAPCINDVSVATITINPQPNAGTDGNTTVCDSSIASIDLFSLITGEQTGGTWTRLTGTGGTFNAGAGTFVPAAGATSSTFQYSLTGTAPCINDVSVATITINPQPNAGTDGNTTVCDSSIASIDLFSLITGEQAGGAWTRLTGTGGTFNAGAGTFVPAAGATSSTFQYSLTGTAPCVNDVSVATVNVNPTLSPTINCGTSTTTTVQFTWTAVAGATGYNLIYQVNATPAVNVGAIGNVLTYTVTGLVPGDNVLITLTPTGGAGTCFTFSTLTCTANNCTPPTANISYGTPFCNATLVGQAVTLTGTGVFTGGTYAANPATPNLTINATTGAIIPSTSVPGTYTVEYTIPAVAGCSPVIASTSVTINAQPNAGTDGNTTICDSSVASIDLFSLITGEQTGGTWTRLTGTGGTFNAGAGTFVPAAGATSSTFQYSLTGTAPCINDVSVATITINAQPNAGTDGNTTVCDSSIASIDLFSLITGEQAGGTWTRLTGTGGTFNAGAGTFVPAAGATSSTFQYSLTGTAPCINDVSVATITINAQPNAGTDGNTTVCDSSVASIDLFSLITGEQAGGTWTRLTGTGGTFNAGAGTFVPAAGATSSTFQYSLTGTAPCINDVSVATITINAQPNAGTDGNTTVCDSSIASIDLFSLITGEQAGGTWTRLTGTGGTFNAGAGTFVPAAGATSSTFQYSLTGTAPCINDVSVATITINAQPNAGTDGNTTVCDSSIASIDLFSLITGEQTGGTWTRLTGTGGTFNAGAGTFVPAAGATSSTFQYSLTGTAPCINDVSVATITINAQPNAGTDGNTTICDSSIASIDLFSLITGEQAGGTWTRLTGTGGTFNAGAGTFVPAAGATSSTFQYSLTGIAPCINDVSVATITINPQPNAGTDGNTTVCDSSIASIDLFSLITGEQTGGTWTRLTGTGGTFNAGAGTFVPAAGATSSTFQYSLTGTAPCINDVSVATITINPQPNAGTDGNTTVCDSSIASIDLFSLITGEQAGGAWTRLTGTGGTFNAGAGTFVPAAGATSSTFQYSLTGTAPCVNDVSVATVNVNPTLSPTINCGTSTTTTVQFTWTAVAGATGYNLIYQVNATPAVNVGAIGNVLTYTVTGLVPGDNVLITLTPTGGAGTCFTFSTLTCTANNCTPPTANISYGTPFCNATLVGQAVTLTGTGVFTGGTYAVNPATPNLTINATTGAIIPSTSVPGTYTVEYTIPAVAGCSPVIASTSVTINAQPNAGTDGNTTICDSSVASIDLFSLITGEQTGGTWTRLTGTGGTFNAGAGTFVPAAGATSSTFQYSLTGTAPCINDVSVATITINAQPNAGTDGNTTVCDSSIASIDLFSLITGEQTGGTWTRLTGTGGTFNAGAGTFIPAAGATSSTFQYSLTGTAPCINDVSVATITINPQPNAGTDGNTTVCDSSVASIDLFSLITGEQTGGTWTRLTGTGGTFNAGAGTFVPAAGATSSTFQYSLTGTAPCINDVSVATITINPQPNAGTDGNTTVCDSSIASIDLFSLITGEQAGGTWTRLTGTGGTFNAGAGTFVPAAGATSSTFQYSLTGTVPCINDVSVATITINAQPNAGTDGNTTVCDSSIASIDLFSLITGEQTGGTWTRLTGTGGTFNAGAGTFVPAAGATSSTFQYSLTGTAPCINDVSVATITINAQPNAGTDGNTTVCDSSIASIDLFSLITGEQAGGAWTRLTGTGGTFNAGAGTFVPAAGATSSTFQYSLTGTAPCINDVSVATITINPQPNAGTDGNTTVCDSSVASINLFSLITGEQAGGTWTRLTGTGGTFNAGAGTFVPAAGATSSTFQYSLTGTAPCINDVSVATINIYGQLDAGTDGNTTVCDSSVTSIDLFSLITGEQAGGTWTRLTGTGGTFNAGAGTFVPAAGATSSTFQYSLTGTAPCINDVSVATITINPQPNAGTDGNTTVCDSSVTSIDLFSLITGEQAGGTWTRLTGTGGTFNAGAGTFVPAAGATSSTFQYSLTGTAPCINDVSVATITINAQPNAGTDGNTTVCDSSVASIDLFSLITGEQAGGTWTRLTGTGGTFNAGAATFVPAAGATSSTFQYSLTGTAPCINDVSVATITINPQPNAGTDGGTIICDSSSASINLFDLIAGEQLGGIWTRLTGTGGTFNAGTGTFVPVGGATSSTFQYSLTGTAPCVNSTSIATITINSQPDAGNDGDIVACDSDMVNLFDIITGEQPGGVWTRTSGTGGIFDPVAATFTSAPGATISTFTYTLTAIGPCIDDSSVATVDISVTPAILLVDTSTYFSDVTYVSINVSPVSPDYEYSLDGGAFQDENIFHNVTSGEHEVTVRNKKGCGQKSDEFLIINYPHYFTPNGDGYHETWNIFELAHQLNSKIYIFDRFSKFLKEIRPSGTGWDGTLNGQPLPSTDYWFVVYYEEKGMSKEFRAHFAMKR